MKTPKRFWGRVSAAMLVIVLCLTGGVVAFAAGSYSVEYRPGTVDTVTNMPEPGNAATGETYTVSALSPQREGYEFMGWLMEYEEAEYTSYEVRYLEEGTDKELKEPKAVPDQIIGATVTETAPEITDYELVSDTTQNLVLKESDNVITFYYKPAKKLTSYTVYYLDMFTNMHLTDSKTVTDQEVGKTVTEYSVVIEGYIFLEPEKTITLEEKDNNIYFFYASKVA